MGSLTSVVALSKQSQVSNPNPKSQSHAMSRSSYPSAHGHTPSYRSAASTVYPSALGSDKLWPQAEKDFHTTFHFPQTGSFSSGLSSRSTLSTDLDRDMARHVNSSLSTSTRSPLNTTTHSGSSSSYKTEKYSSSSVSSTNGGLPHRESHHDSTYRSTRVGDSGIPHTSYAHTTSSFDSDRPYKNAVSNFSYNI